MIEPRKTRRDKKALSKIFDFHKYRRNIVWPKSMVDVRSSYTAKLILHSRKYCLYVIISPFGVYFHIFVANYLPNRMSDTIVIDGKGHLLGRLASICAKQLLNGKKIVVVRSEQIVVSGSRKYSINVLFEHNVVLCLCE